VAVCRLLSTHGFYRFAGRDDDGWPQWEATQDLPAMTAAEQEQLLKQSIIRAGNNREYFIIDEYQPGENYEHRYSYNRIQSADIHRLRRYGFAFV
jgi:hypothetical protein